MEPNKRNAIPLDEPDYRALGLPEPSAVRDGADPRLGMTVPDGFFADMQRRVEAEIDRTERIARLRRLRPWGVAASVVLIVGLFTLIGGARRAADAPAAGADLVAQLPAAEADAVSAATESEAEADMLLASLSDYDIYEAFYADLD